MKLLADDQPRRAKEKIDTTGETAMTQHFNRRQRLFHALEIICATEDPDLDDVIDAFVQFVGDKYASHLVKRIREKC